MILFNRETNDKRKGLVITWGEEYKNENFDTSSKSSKLSSSLKSIVNHHIAELKQNRKTVWFVLL